MLTNVGAVEIILDLPVSDNYPAARQGHFLLRMLGSDCLQSHSATSRLYLGIAPSLAS